MGSGCVSVGRAVASDTRGPRFESVIDKLYIEHLFIVNFIEKTKIKKKRPEMAHLKKISTKSCLVISQLPFGYLLKNSVT